MVAPRRSLAPVSEPITSGLAVGVDGKPTSIVLAKKIGPGCSYTVTVRAELQNYRMRISVG
jgi:hypothetical protein